MVYTSLVSGSLLECLNGCFSDGILNWMVKGKFIKKSRTGNVYINNGKFVEIAVGGTTSGM